MEVNIYSERQRYIYKRNPKIAIIIDICKANFIRLCFLALSIFCIYFLVARRNIYTWLILIINLVIIVVDAIYVSIKRKGQEYLW